MRDRRQAPGHSIPSLPPLLPQGHREGGGEVQARLAGILRAEGSPLSPVPKVDIRIPGQGTSGSHSGNNK